MKKACVICGLDFDASGSGLTCSEECKRTRINQTRRKLDRSEERARYRAKHREKILAYKREYRAKKKAAWELANPELAAEKARLRSDRQERAKPKVRLCLVCGGPFVAKNNTKTCSEECWIERHRDLRGRPEKYLDPQERLAKKRAAQNRLNNERRAALKLVRELQTNPERIIL